MAEHIVIGDIAPRVQYVASGAQSAFTYPFPIFKPADLEVFLDGARQSGGFTVAGAGQSSGGTLTFAAPPAAGTIVTLRRRLALQRLSDFQENGELRARVLNDELDYQVAALQQLADDLGRALQFAPTETGVAPMLPPRAARASRLLGFDAAGGVQLYAAESGTSQTLFRQDGAGAVPRTAQDKFTEAFSVADFGAAGDGQSDDTQAIQAAFDAAGALGRLVLIPEGDWRITRGLILPGGAAGLVMRGRLVAEPAAPEAALTLGDGGAVRNGEKLYWGIRVVRTTLSDWLDERDIGVVLRNIDASLVQIAEARNFTIGVRTLGDERGVEDTTVLLGRIVDNRIGLDIRAGTAAGWNASMRYDGGHFAVSGATWPAIDRFGVRLSAAPGAYRAHNRHVFDAPNFELRQQGGNVAIPFLCEVDSRAVIARDIRMEGCSPIVARHTAGAQDHLYDVAWASQGYLLDVEYAATATRAGAVLRTRHQSAAHAEATRLVGDVPNLRSAAFRWGAGQTGFAQLACVSANVSGSPSRIEDFAFPALSGYAPTDRGVVITAARGLGFVVDTRACRDFALAADADAPRLFVQCFDAAGTLLTDAAGTVARASGQGLAWNPTARWWQGSGDMTDAALTRLQALRLDAQVATAIIGICRVDADYEARALRLYCEPRHAPALLYGTPAFPHGSREIVAETSWDPPSIAAGATQQVNMTVTGASPGDFVQATFSVATTAILFIATVGAANTVTVVAWNRASSAIDLAGGTLRVRVIKA
ncbi:glycosyl hydrolase family 28-related protein [Elioraea sp.]|uniref:glycosyl hydrolase family 28-related protein n=1 Tax=Elioraea sp. TaxID=2185103 RepID=UPI00307D59DE